MSCRIKPFIPDPFEGRALFIDWDSGPRPSLGRDVADEMAELRITEEQRPIETQEQDEELEIPEISEDGEVIFDWRSFWANEKSYWLWILEACVSPPKRQFIIAQLDLIERNYYKLGYDEPSFPPAPPIITFDTEGLSDWELYLESGDIPLSVTSLERGEAHVLRCWKSDCESTLTVYGDVAPNAVYDCERHHRIRTLVHTRCGIEDSAGKNPPKASRFQNTAFDAHYARNKGSAVPDGEMPLVATAARRDKHNHIPETTALERFARLSHDRITPEVRADLKQHFVDCIAHDAEHALNERPQMELDDFENRDGWHWTYPFNYLPSGAKLEELPRDPETYVTKSGKKRKHFWTDTGFVKSNWVDSSPEARDDGDDDGGIEERHGYHGDHVFNPNVKATKKDKTNTHHARRKYEGITNMRMEEGAYPAPDFPGSFDKTNREFRIRQAIYAWRHGEYTQAEAAARNAVDGDITAVTISRRWKEIQSGTEKLRTVVGPTSPEPPAEAVARGGPWVAIHRANGRWYWFPIDYADFMVNGNDRIDAIIEAERELRNRLMLYEIYSALADAGRGAVKRKRAWDKAIAKAAAEWAARKVRDLGGPVRS